jgi:hypothetical protein
MLQMQRAGQHMRPQKTGTTRISSGSNTWKLCTGVLVLSCTQLHAVSCNVYHIVGSPAEYDPWYTVEVTSTAKQTLSR